MSHDAPEIPPSGTATPANGGGPSVSKNGLLGGPPAPAPKYLAGSKALDALAKLITNCESMFHPSVRLPKSDLLRHLRSSGLLIVLRLPSPSRTLANRV